MPFDPPRRSWLKKFTDAFHGLWLGVVGQSSFVVHLICAAIVVALGIWLEASPTEWLVLALCITLVLTAEMFNSALERLAKSLDDEHNPHLADGLNIASAAVLIAALGTAVAGAIIFVPKLFALFGDSSQLGGR